MIENLKEEQEYFYWDKTNECWYYIGNYDDVLELLARHYKDTFEWKDRKNISYCHARYDEYFENIYFSFTIKRKNGYVYVIENMEDKALVIYDLKKDVYDYINLGKRFCKTQDCNVLDYYSKTEKYREHRNTWFWDSNRLQYKLKKCWRRIKTTQERRFACDNEHKQYVRAKRNKNNLANIWDDITISYDTSWKSRYKVKKQYMKNL